MNKFNAPFEIEKILPERLCSGFNKKLPSPLNGNSGIFTLYGRNALYFGSKSLLRKTSKRVILVPSYSCGDEIKTIINAGFKIEVYQVNHHNLQAKMEDIKQKINKNTAGILVTHYFGFPQKEIGAFRNLSKENKVFLIEDCAHCLGSKFNGRPLGSFGDFSVFSLRKFFPIPHGGALVVNNPDLVPEVPTEPNSEAVNFDTFLFLGFRTGALSPGTPIKEIFGKLGNEEYDQHGPRLPSFGGYQLGISRLAKSILKMIDIEGIVKEHTENFRYYLSFFRKKADQKARPLFSELMEEVVPFVFPLLVEDSEKLAEKLLKRSLVIGQPFWSYLHEFVDWDKFPEIKAIKKGLFVLPVSQRIGEDDLKLLVELLSHSNI